MSFSYKIGSDKRFSTNDGSADTEKTSNSTLAGSTVIETIPTNPSRFSPNQEVVVRGVKINTGDSEDLKKMNILSSQNLISKNGYVNKQSYGDVSGVTSNFFSSIGCKVTTTSINYSLLQEQTSQPKTNNPNISIPSDYRLKQGTKKSTDKFKSANDPFYDNGETLPNKKKTNLAIERDNLNNSKAFDIANYLAVYNSDPINKKKLKTFTTPVSYSRAIDFKKTIKTVNLEVDGNG